MPKKKEKLPQTIPLKEYAEVLTGIKDRIKETQIRATLAANKELIKLYWSIGETIAQKQKESGWGSSIIDTLAQDLQKAFPGIGGLSRRNIFRMRAFYLAYEFVPQAVAQLEESPIFSIPW